MNPEPNSISYSGLSEEPRAKKYLSYHDLSMKNPELNNFSPTILSPGWTLSQIVSPILVFPKNPELNISPILLSIWRTRS